MADDVLAGLDDSERQSLHQFCQVTNVDDLGLATGVLRSQQWNVQQAIQQYYEEPAGERTGLRQRTTGAGSSSEAPPDETPPDEAQREIAAEARQPGFALAPLLAWPFALALQLAAGVVQMVLRLLGLRRIAAVGVPEAAAAQGFRAYFESRFGQRHPPFYDGTFADARAAARREQRYLVAVLWSREHDDAELLGRALAREDVAAYLSQAQFVVWAGDAGDGDAYAASWELGAAAFPAIAVLAPGRGGLRLAARMDGVSAAGGADGLARAVVRLVEAPVARHGRGVARQRQAQQGREAERQLREQQNAAYEASLARDRERARAQQEQEQREQRAREQAAEAARREEQLAQQRRQWQWAALARLQRTDALQGEGRLSLRLEGGQRVVQAFSPAARVQHVFDFVETRQAAAEHAAGARPFGELDAVEAPSGYEHAYEFALVSQFPRVVFGDRDAGLRDALAPHGLWPSATLFVEPLYEPSDSDS
ncbi:Ubx domain-containing protein [Coemansia sp. RSA 2704]|nr:Ubx domain-containing protein [Coemansia sp. RSA 2704]